MPRHPLHLMALLLVAGVLSGCPDSRLPNVPTTPKVPEPKADMAPRVMALSLAAPHPLQFYKETS